MSSRPNVHQQPSNNGVRLRANRRPTSIPTLTNATHALSLFRDNELVGPPTKRKRDHNKGALLESPNKTLLEAAENGYTEALQYALDAGADVNATDEVS